uniref:Uncharacterized protein n=1 Tax=Romanomermis culicivorax TaxID=13658 RepID=A0A915HWY0_ROMCU
MNKNKNKPLKGISTNDTLIITMFVEDDAFDHMFSKSGLHGNNNWAVSDDDGSISDFDLSADRWLK